MAGVYASLDRNTMAGLVARLLPRGVRRELFDSTLVAILSYVVDLRGDWLIRTIQLHLAAQHDSPSRMAGRGPRPRVGMSYSPWWKSSHRGLQLVERVQA